MTHKTRKILFIFFSFLFFTISPTIVFFASGYKYNFEEGIIQKTGLINIKSTPNKATVLLNNQEQYHLLKKLLFKKEDPIKTPANIINLLPNNYSITLKKEGFWSWQKNVTLKPNNAINLKNIYLLEKNLPELLANLNITHTNITSNFNHILIQAKEGFYTLNIKNEIIEEVTTYKLTNVANKTINFITDKNWLEKENNHPKSKNKANSIKNTYLNDFIKKNNITFNKKLNNNTSIVDNNQKLWEFSQKNNSIKLLTNSRDQILFTEIMPKEHYIIYATKNYINAYNPRDMNGYLLANLKNISNIYFNYPKKTLYFSGTLGSKTGYYKLKI